MANQPVCFCSSKTCQRHSFNIRHFSTCHQWSTALIPSNRILKTQNSIKLAENTWGWLRSRRLNQDHICYLETVQEQLVLAETFTWCKSVQAKGIECFPETHNIAGFCICLHTLRFYAVGQFGFFILFPSYMVASYAACVLSTLFVDEFSYATAFLTFQVQVLFVKGFASFDQLTAYLKRSFSYWSIRVESTWNTQCSKLLLHSSSKQKGGKESKAQHYHHHRKCKANTWSEYITHCVSNL